MFKLCICLRWYAKRNNYSHDRYNELNYKYNELNYKIKSINWGSDILNFIKLIFEVTVLVPRGVIHEHLRQVQITFHF